MSEYVEEEGVEEKELKWAEDLAYAHNPYCPYCGREFKLGDLVVEVRNLFIAHKKCFYTYVPPALDDC
jgi:hypothetical protein